MPLLDRRSALSYINHTAAALVLLELRFVFASSYPKLHVLECFKWPRMRILEVIVSLLTGSSTYAPPSTFVPASTAGTDELAAQALRTLRRFEGSRPQGYGAPRSSCNLRNAYVRREWDTFTPTEKRSYIDAVLCLMSKPSIGGDFAPGARSRYDDFLAVHINQTATIHGTVSRLCLIFESQS